MKEFRDHYDKRRKVRKKDCNHEWVQAPVYFGTGHDQQIGTKEVCRKCLMER